jgi:CHASE3 domain sensor protein
MRNNPDREDTGMLERLWHRYARAALVGGTVLFLLSNMGVVWLAQFQLNELRDAYVTDEKLRDTTESLLVGLLGAEAGARGFLITGDEIYLSPYHTGVALVGDQVRIYSLLSLDEARRGTVAQVVAMTNRQLAELASLIRLRREQGQAISAERFQSGADKMGLETLKSSIERTVADLSNVMGTVQGRSKDYQTISGYCVMFAAFWLYLIIFLAMSRPRDGG